jgi:hypothetical protein
LVLQNQQNSTQPSQLQCWCDFSKKQDTND